MTSSPLSRSLTLSQVFRFFLLAGLTLAGRLWAITPVPYTEGVSFSCAVVGVGGGMMTVNGEGASPVVSTSTYYVWAESPSDLAWLRPGRQYLMNFQSSGITGFWLSLIAPTGYAVYVDGQPTDLIAGTTGGGGYTHDYILELRPVANPGRGDAASFSGIELGKSITWDAGLGGLRTGRSAGRILFKELDLFVNTPDARARLYYAAPANVGQITVVYDGPSNQTLRQVSVPQTVVDLVDDLTYGGYWMNFYEPSQATWGGSLYTFTGSPWKTLRVESPSLGQLKITETEGSVSRVSLLSLTSLATGGTVTTAGGYTIHTFTSGGTFTVNSAISGADAIVVAGGGGGGEQHAGGGGAGGLIPLNSFSIGTGSYGITIGTGGAGCTAYPFTGTDGSDSTAFGYTAIGGGAGTGMSAYGNNGGSGGGDGFPTGGAQGGNGTAGQGNNGSTTSSGSPFDGGGGGGAGGAGYTYYGGAAASTWAGLLAGGGGGGFAGGPGGGGGAGNGGSGAANGDNAAPNSGGGGGGGGNLGGNGGNGGSGIVIIRYPQASWQLQEGDGTTWLRTTTHTNTSPSAGVRDDTVIVRTGGAAGTIVAKTKYRYEQNLLINWGEELTQVVADPDTAALTTDYDYYTTSSDYGNYRKVKSVTSPTGGWVSYLYYDDWDRRGQVAIETRPWINTHSTVQTPAGSTDNSVVHDYVADFTGRYRIEATHENLTTNVRTGYTATSPTLNQTQDSELYTLYQTDAYSGTSTYQRSISAVIDSGNGSNSPDYTGQPFSVKRPDSTQDSYTHHTGSFNYSTKAFTYPGDGSHYRTTVWHGTTNSSGADSYTAYDSMTVAQIYLIANRSTMDVTIRNPMGDIVRTETHVYIGSGSFTLLSYEDFTYDAAGRLTSRTASNGATVTNTYTNGRLTSTVGIDGTETQFTYDELGRVATSVKKGVASSGSYAAQGDITTTNTYDGAGRVTQSVTGSSPSLTATAAYDLAGRTSSSTAPGSYTTSFAYSSGGKIVTATFPGGATKITETYLDGQAKSLSGTGVVAEDYTYSIDGSGNQVRDAIYGGNTSAAVDTTNDWLGRAIQETKPGWSGSSVSRLSYYNSSGQLYKFTQPGAADTLYLYDSLGQLYLQGLDLNANGSLDTASNDRLSGSTFGIYTYDGGTTWWTQTVNYTYATASSSTITYTGQSYEKLKNFGTNIQRETISYDINGNGTSASVTVDRTNKKVTTTTAVPDSSTSATQVAYNGLLVEATDTTAVTMRYGYDALGRQNTSVDPRTGTTTTAYVSGTSQVYTVTDPASVVQATYTYDSAGRVATVTNALSKVCRYAYTNRNEKYRVWGDTDNPVEYGYNALGQQTTMKTYRGGTGWTGGGWPGSPGTADTTTWAYQAYTNLLASKTDAASKSVNFTYTQAGQVYTREWARILTGSTHVTTTYGYDSATGELLTVDYNDSNTADLTYTYNRLGQVATVVDSAGTRTFGYNLAGTLELQHEDLPSFYGSSRRITYPYATSGVIGRPTGLQLGTTSSPTADQSTTYGYDSSGRLNSVAGGSQTFGYTYTSNSHLLATVTNSGANYTDTRSYDTYHDWTDNRTTTISSIAKAAFAYTQDNLGRVTQVAKTGELFNRYGNATQGLDTYCGYDDRSQLTSEQTKLGGSGTVLTGRDDAHAYDPIGNRTTVTHNSNSATYTANALNQYTQRTVPGVFDVAGAAASAATVTVNGSSSGVTRHGDYFFKGHSLSNNPNPVYTTLAISDGTTTSNLAAFLWGTPQAFTYDDDGNLLSDGRFEYTYDAENRPIWIQTGTAAAAAGVPVEADNPMYDYLGRRVLKARYSWNGVSWSQTSQERYVYNGWNLIAVGDASFTIAKNCYWGLDLSGTGQGAGGVGGLLMVQESGNSYLPLYDALGNVHGMIQASNGSLVAAYEYDAFGQTLRESGPYAASNPFRYSTKYTDTETGLVYYGMRYYSPSLGRFINKDPSEESGGLNLYGFCGNNGVNHYDVLGRDWNFSDSELAQITQWRQNPTDDTSAWTQDMRNFVGWQDSFTAAAEWQDQYSGFLAEFNAHANNADSNWAPGLDSYNSMVDAGQVNLVNLRPAQATPGTPTVVSDASPSAPNRTGVMGAVAPQNSGTTTSGGPRTITPLLISQPVLVLSAILDSGPGGAASRAILTAGAQVDHYDRNQFNNLPDPATVKSTWVQLNNYQSNFHRVGPGADVNVKFVSPDGTREAVFHGLDGPLVTDPINLGTYNYASPLSNPIQHIMLDVVPFVIWGNSEADPRSFPQRVFQTGEATLGIRP